uniref:NADH-ubiquinone oxidoreductase chain 5 n=1 Tax=Dinocampus coccinellae TaxID=144245 RepID=A0A343YVC9_9HYME|nr:NADH dehydrogenase subunit 5 [Dinocampus coccinellae]
MLFFYSFILMIMKMKFMLNWYLIKIMSFKIEMIIYMDWMTLLFMSVITLISSMIIIYSMNYMENDLNINRFMYLILIFMISMIFMISSPNMFSILLGWDGLGLSSYCLIIYYQSMKSFNSGMMTILMNRIGDINILILISILINKSSLNMMFSKNTCLMIFILLLMASITKSAQIPFSTWLPLAMAAPTPVSSLVHSSTLVTAGIYLLIRFIHMIPTSMFMILMMIACLTMMMASTCAFYEYDIKKIIALSTLSQLGFMFLTISIKLPTLSFFHLITHAMFKSLLFMCSGIMIHNYTNNQDIRQINFMNINNPMINTIFTVSLMSLSGVPFLSGYYSKDLIIEMFNIKNLNMITYWFMYYSMSMTVMYSFRMIKFINMKPIKLMIFSINKMNLMLYSLFILFFMTIFYGSMISWFMLTSMNKIILSMFNKLLIFKLSILLIIIMLMNMNNYYNYNSKLNFFNYSMWMTNLPLKKFKMILMINNNNMNKIIDLGWIEYFMIKKFMFTMVKMNMNKFSLMTMMLMTLTYLIIIMYM